MYVHHRNTAFEDNPIRNYYETLVVEMLGDYVDENLDSDTLSDIACIALNNLPAKYIRYDVDMAFFNTPEETQQMRDRVRVAIANAEQKLKSHPR